MRKWLVPLIVLALVAPPTRSSRAEDPAEEQEEGVRLSLADCLRASLENNLDLVIARKDPEIAQFDLDSEAANFDPQIVAGLTHSESRDEPSAVFQSTRSMVEESSVSWTDRLRFGGSYGIEFSGSKVDAPNPFRFYNPSYDAALTLSFTMPLLRGFGVEPTTQALILAQANMEISREDLGRQAQAVLEQVESAYWDLVAAREALRVARSSLRLAGDLRELNKKKVEVGTLAPIEITQAEAGVASREEGVIVAETTLANAEDELRRLLAVPKDDELWVLRPLPTDHPTFEARPLNLDLALAQALEARPEMANARRDLENKRLAERVAKNGVRHGLDLNTSVAPSGNNLKNVMSVPDPGPDGILGTADDGVILVPVTDGIGEAVSEIPGFRNYNWSIGLTYSIPIGNRQARAAYGRATLDREKSELALQNLDQTIRVEVRSVVRNVESGIKRVAAARANTTLQRKKLEAEQKKFENGMSTSFEVLTFQNDLANAELAEIRALADYNKALAALERAQGTLLEARGLRLETDEVE